MSSEDEEDAPYSPTGTNDEEPSTPKNEVEEMNVEATENDTQTNGDAKYAPGEYSADVTMSPPSNESNEAAASTNPSDGVANNNPPDTVVSETGSDEPALSAVPAVDNLASTATVASPSATSSASLSAGFATATALGSFERDRSVTPQSVATPPILPVNDDSNAFTAAKSGIAAMRSHKRKRRQPQDKVEQLRLQVAEEPHDTDAWLALLTEYERRADLENTRDTYEKFLKIYPTATHQWIKYIELEMENNEFQRVEALFARCLRVVASVDLFKFYLNYVRRMNNINVGGAEARATVSKAYEFVLQHVGLDRDSSSIWTEYIGFVKTGQAHNTWEEQQKMDTLRRIYQRAVCIPINNIESVWREYDQFENSLNRITAKKFLQEKSPAYMTARSALRELKTYTDNIARPVLPKNPTFTDKEMQQLDAWKQYIQWEKNNPLVYEDQTALHARVTYVYKQALMHMRYYPELWFDAANYCIEINKLDDAAVMLKQGMEALPTSCLVHFAYTELEEVRKQDGEARSAFESLLANLDQRIQKVQFKAEDQIDELNEREKVNKPPEKELAEMDADAKESLKKQTAEFAERRKAFEDKRNALVAELKEAVSLTWVEYMRFTRRSEGIKPARLIFAKARKSPHCTWHVYAASALMEFHVSKEAVVATKIFELGLKHYSLDAGFVYQYLDFLLAINDNTNARALFERSIAKIPADQTIQLWKRFSRYEYQFGDLAGIQKLRSRMQELFPSEPPIERFTAQHMFAGLRSVYELDLGTHADGGHSDRAGDDTASESEDESTIAATNGTAAARSPPPPPRANAGMPSATNRRAGVFRNSPQRGTPPPMGPPPHGLPDAVAFFMSQLPPANVFNGPKYPVNQIIDMLMGADVPQPSAGAAGRRRRGGVKRRGREGSYDDNDGGFVKRYRH